jgi:hypothetical protein
MKRTVIGIICLLLFTGSAFGANKRITLTTAITKPHYATHIDEIFLTINKDPKRIQIGYSLQYLDGTWITTDEIILTYSGTDVNTFIAKHDAHDFTTVDIEEFILQELIDAGLFAGTIE